MTKTPAPGEMEALTEIRRRLSPDLPTVFDRILTFYQALRRQDSFIYLVDRTCTGWSTRLVPAFSL
jgi:hypothetical protein